MEQNELLGYHEVVEALNRFILRYEHKANISRTPKIKRENHAKVMFYKSIKHYIDIHAKRHIH